MLDEIKEITVVDKVAYTFLRYIKLVGKCKL